MVLVALHFSELLKRHLLVYANAKTTTEGHNEPMSISEECFRVLWLILAVFLDYTYFLY